MSLSTRQQRILLFIGEFRQQHGYPPTIREIGSALGISSTSVVNYNLNILEREGHIRRDREVSRGLRLVAQDDDGDRVRGLVRVPLLGTIAAGEPIPVPEADTDLFGEEAIQLTRDILPDQENIYALRVKGDSMIDALIHDGDVVVMRHQEEAKNGDLVAVWLRDEKETTLKRFYLESDHVRLQPANPTMSPIYVHPRNVEIQGKVIAVVRQLW